MDLELVEILQGSFSLVFTIITVIIGIRICFRFFEKKNREYLLIGLSWIGMALAWASDSLSFLSIIFLNTPISEALYFMISVGFLPFVLIIWLFAWTDLVWKEKQKIILILTIIFSIIYEIMFWYLLFTDITQIGKFLGYFHVEYGLVVIIPAMVVIVVFFITGLIFSFHSIKSDDALINLRGKLFLIAIILFTVGAILDSSVPLLPITVVITRLILISSSISFYFAYMMPAWVKKNFIK